jgi:threonine dehydrogenase-like Zn-dependent dehydrogenase
VNVGDRVLVAGFGMIGSLLARVLKMMPAVDLFILEKDEGKRTWARQLGFQLLADTPEHFFDVAFNTTASGNALQQCIDLVGLEGRIIELSWYGNASVNLALGSDFHYLRKKIISSQVSRIPAERGSRWDYHRRKTVVLELLKSEAFDNHITKVIPFEETPAFFKDLRQGNFKGLGCCIKY